MRGCKGLAERVGVCRGDSPDGVTESFHSLHDSVKEFQAGCFDILRVILSLVGEEGSECVRVGVVDVGVACMSVAGGVSAAAAMSA